MLLVAALKLIHVSLAEQTHAAGEGPQCPTSPDGSSHCCEESLKRNLDSKDFEGATRIVKGPKVFKRKRGWWFKWPCSKCFESTFSIIPNLFQRGWRMIEISFGGIPNSSSIHTYISYIYIYMYVRIYKTLCHVWLHGRHFFCAVVLPMWTMYHQKVLKTITWLLLSRLPGNKSASGTYTPARIGTLRNLPHRNPPEPSGTCLRNLHQHRPEPSGTFRNLPPEPTPAHAGTLRNLPSEPTPATRTGTHRSLSGLKTPLAYAVGEKSLKPPDQQKMQKFVPSSANVTSGQPPVWKAKVGFDGKQPAIRTLGEQKYPSHWGIQPAEFIRYVRYGMALKKLGISLTKP